MRHSTRILPAPITLDIAVSMTAIVRPEPEAGGFSAEVPALPGCCTQGETLDEVRTNLREAIEGWLAAAHEDGSIMPDTLRTPANR